MIGFTKSFWGSLCVVAAVIVGIPAVAQAQPEGVYDFTAPPGDQGTDATFGSNPAGGGDITASGFTDPVQLNGKCPDILPLNRACLFVTDDLGLGIKDPANQNRITSDDFVQLDLSNLK